MTQIMQAEPGTAVYGPRQEVELAQPPATEERARWPGTLGLRQVNGIQEAPPCGSISLQPLH